jgi:hypothetical protein
MLPIAFGFGGLWRAFGDFLRPPEVPRQGFFGPNLEKLETN